MQRRHHTARGESEHRSESERAAFCCHPIETPIRCAHQAKRPRAVEGAGEAVQRSDDAGRVHSKQRSLIEHAAERRRAVEGAVVGLTQ